MSGECRMDDCNGRCGLMAPMKFYYAYIVMRTKYGLDVSREWISIDMRRLDFPAGPVEAPKLGRPSEVMQFA